MTIDIHSNVKERFLEVFINEKAKFNNILVLNAFTIHESFKNWKSMVAPVLLLFFLTASLRYKSHTIQFIHLKCTIEWLLVHSQICATITTVNFQSFSSPQKETQSPLGITAPPPFSYPSPALRN